MFIKRELTKLIIVYLPNQREMTELIIVHLPNKTLNRLTKELCRRIRILSEITFGLFLLFYFLLLFFSVENKFWEGWRDASAVTNTHMPAQNCP